MGLYWRRSTKILPGVRINWSKSGPSVSVGPRGAKVNFGKRGTFVSGGIPGTGLYYRQKVGGGKKQTSINTGYNPNPTYPAGSYPGGSTSSFFTSKGCLISIIGSIALSLLLSGNFLTLLIFAAICGVVCFFWYKKQQSANYANGQQTQQSNTQPVPPIQPNPTPMSARTDQQDQNNADVLDIKVAVAEVEHLVGEIDKSNDKIKLPSYYRRLMSIVNKLEKYDNVRIKGMPVKEAKRRILENYRKKMH